MGPQLHPTQDNKRITYKSLITGSIKHDPQFGLFAGQTNGALNQETRVIKLNSISDICDDKREVRAVIVNGRTPGDTEKYLVIEADTAEFYYAKLNTTASGELTFLKTTPNDLSLVNGYRNKFSIRQGVSRTPLDAEFIALPKLDSALAELKRLGYQKTATGLGPGNQIRSASDIARADAASQTLAWLRRSIPSSARNRSDMIMKAGAGNYGEMALLSRDIIKKSGGNAYEWAGIASPAREYTQKLKEVMTQWERDGIKIVEGNKTISPLDTSWMDALITKPKTPYPHGYINP